MKGAPAPSSSFIHRPPVLITMHHRMGPHSSSSSGEASSKGGERGRTETGISGSKYFNFSRGRRGCFLDGLNCARGGKVKAMTANGHAAVGLNGYLNGLPEEMTVHTVCVFTTGLEIVHERERRYCQSFTFFVTS